MSTTTPAPQNADPTRTPPGPDVLKTLRADLANNPHDIETLARLVEGSVARRAARVLASGAEAVVRNVDGPLAVRPVAESVAGAIDRVAGVSSSRFSLELQLRRARLLQACASDPAGAAAALAAAWQACPDERVAIAAQLLVPPTEELWEAPLEALAAVADGPKRREALKALAAAALERRHLARARRFFETLPADDGDARPGLESIGKLEDIGAVEVERIEKKLASASTPAEKAAAWHALARVHRGLGEFERSRAAFRAAIQNGAADAIIALDELFRDHGRARDLRAEIEDILRDAPPTLHHPLRRRLFELAREQGGAPAEAASVLQKSRPRSEDAARKAFDEAETFERKDQTALAAARYEDAATLSADTTTRLEALTRGARLFERTGKTNDAERLWRKVRAMDPRSRAALGFYRAHFAATNDERRLYQVLLQLHALESNPVERRALAEEMGVLAEQVLNDADKAIEALRLVEKDLGASEDPRPVWHRLRELCATAGRWHAWVELVEKEVNHLPADAVAERVELLFAMVEVFQDPERLPMPAMVQATYQRIVELEPQQTVALEKLCTSLEEREQWEDLRNVLSSKVEFAEPHEIIPIFERIAELYLDHIKSDSQAIAVLEQLLELDPADVAVMHRLRELYRKRHAAPELYENLDYELRLENEPHHRVALLAEQATIAEHRMLKPDLAIERWKEVLALEPRHGEALAALARLHAEQSDWPAWVTVQERRIAETTNKTARLPLLFDLGEVLYLRVADTAKADAIFRTIAASSATSATARRFLQRIFVQHRKWDELQRLFGDSATGTPQAKELRAYIQVLEDAIKTADGDDGLVVDILIELARVHRGTNEAERALASMMRALAVAPDRIDIAEEALTLLGDDGDSERRAEILKVMAQHGAEPNAKLAAWLDVATIARAGRRGDEAFAASCKAVVVAAELGSLDALDGFERDAEMTSRWEEAWQALDEALPRLAPDALMVRAAYHRALGRIAGARLMLADEAVRHFRWVLQLLPGDPAALEELEKIYFSRNDFPGLEEVYRMRAQAAPSGSEPRLKALRAMASLYEDVFVDNEKASAAFFELALDGETSDETVSGLTRTMEARGAWADLASALETMMLNMPSTGQRGRLHQQLFEIYADRLEERVAAIDHARSLFESSETPPDSVVGRLEAWLSEPVLAREVAPVLESAYRRLQRPDRLIEVLELRRLDATGENLIGILDDLAMLEESLARNPRRAFEVLRARFELVPFDITTWDAQARLAEELDRAEELAALWEQGLKSGGALEAALRGQLHWRLAELYHRQLIEIDAAITHIEAALTLITEPRDRQRLHEVLEILHRKNADPEAFIRTKLAAAGEALSRNVRRAKIIDAARTLSGAMRKPDEGLKLLDGLFEEDPGERETGEIYFEVLEKSGRMERLDEARRRAMVATSDSGWRDEIALHRALFLRDTRGEWENAIFELLQLIDSEVSGLNARMALLDITRAEESADQRDVILEDLRNWFTTHDDDEGMIQALLVEAEFATPGHGRAAIHAQAAELAARRFIAGGRAELVLHALQLYGHALMDVPDNLELLQKAEHLAETADSIMEWTEILGECLESFGDGAMTPNLHLAVGKAMLATDRQDEARAAFENVVLHAPRDSGAIRTALRQLGELAAANDATEEALRHFGQLLANAPELHEAVEANGRIADIAAFGEHSADAIDALRRAVAAVRGDIGAFSDGVERLRGLRERLDALLEEVGRDEERVEMLLDQADDASDDEDRLAVLWNVASILRGDDEGEMPDVPPELAIGAWERLNTALGGDDEALAELVRLYGLAGHWSEAVSSLEQRADLAADRGDLAMARRHALDRVQVLIDELDAPELAVEVLTMVLEDEPGHDEALTALGAIVGDARVAEQAESLLVQGFRARGDRTRLANTLEQRLLAGRASGEEIVELVGLTRNEPRRAWGIAARGYAADPLGVDGLACRELVFELTAAHPTQVPTGGALAAMLAAVSRELPTAADRVANADRNLLLLKERDLLDEDSAAPLQRVILLNAPERTDIATSLEAWARRHDRREVLAEILAARAMSLDGDKRATIELERARLLSRLPRQEQAAVAAYGAAILARPNLHEAHRERLTILRRADRAGDELGALKQWVAANPPAEERAEVSRRLFELQVMTDIVGALELAASELVGQPGNPFWPDALERLMGLPDTARGAFRTLENHYRDIGDGVRLLSHYRQLPDLGDENFEAEVLTRRYHFELQLPDGQDDAFRTMLMLVGVADDPLPTIHLLRGMAKNPTRQRELAQALVSRLKVRPSQGVLVSLAELMTERAAEDPQAAPGARAAWEQALAAARGDLALRRGYEKLLRQLGDIPALERSLAEHARLLEPGHTRQRVDIERAGLLGGRLGRHDEAAQLLARIESEAPETELRTEVREATFMLMRHRGAWKDMEAARERWLEEASEDKEKASIEVAFASAFLSPESPRVGDGISALFDLLNRHPGHTAATSTLLRFVRDSQIAAENSPTLARDLNDAVDLIEVHHPDATRADIRALILATRLRLATGTEEQRGLLVELARAESGDRPIVALAHFKAALVVDPSDEGVADELEALVRSRSLFVEGAEALCDIAERTGAVAFYRRAAPIFARELRETARAADCWERSLATGVTDSDALRELITLYAALGEGRSEAAAIEKHLNGTASMAEAAPLRVRLGTLRAEVLNDPEGAIVAFETDLEATVTDTEALPRLERLYARANRHEDLVTLYRTAVSSNADAHMKVKTLSKLAQVLETRLQDIPSAVDSLHAILVLEPANRFAFASLERIEKARGQWDEVDALLTRQLALTESPDLRLKLLLQRATVALAQLAEPAAALAHLEEADALSTQGPGADELVTQLEALLSAEPAVRARAAHLLARRYRARQNWFGLVNVLLVQTGAMEGDSERQSVALETIAVIAERFTANDEGQRRLGLLLALLRQSAGSASVRDAIDREIERDPTAFERVSLFASNLLKRAHEGREKAEADIATWLARHEFKAGRADAAIRALERALLSDALHENAFAILAKHYRDVGDAQRLAGIYDERLALALVEDRPALRLSRVLDVATIIGTDGESSIAAVSAILDEAPDDPRLDDVLLARAHDPATAAIARGAITHRWKTPAARRKLMSALAAAVNSGEDVSAARWRLIVCARAFGDTRIALEQLLVLVGQGQLDDAIIAELEGLATTANAGQEILQALDNAMQSRTDTAVQTTRRALILRARITAAEPARSEDAIAMLRDALHADPDFTEARRELVRLYGARGDFESYIDAANEFSDVITDPAALREVWLELKQLAETGGDPNRAITACQALLALDADDDIAAESLMALLRQTGRLDELAGLLEARLTTADDKAVAAEMLIELGQIRADLYGDDEGAVDAWREAWAMAPELEAPTRKLETVARSRGDLREVGEILAGHAAALAEPVTRAKAWLEAAEAFVEARAFDDARAAAESALEARPGKIAAHDVLVKVFGTQNNFRSLAGALEARARSQREAIERARGFVQAAAVHADRLGDIASAENLIAMALTLKAGLSEAHLLRSRLAKAAGDLPKAVASISAALDDLPPRRRSRALFDLARLHTAMGDDDGSLAALAASLALEPGAADVETLYQSRLEAIGRIDALINHLDTRLRTWAPPANTSTTTDAPESRGAQAMRLIGLASTHAPDDGRIAGWFDAARNDAAADQAAVSVAEAELAIGRSDWAAAVRLLTKALGPLEQRKATDSLVRCLHRIGFAEEKLGHLAQALAAYERAHELNGRDVPNLLSYGRVLVEARKWPTAVVVNQSLLVVKDALSADDHAWVLARLALALVGTGDKTRARTVADRLQKSHPGHPGVALVTAELDA